MMSLSKPNDINTEREILTACFKGGTVDFDREDIVTEVITQLTPDHFEHPHYKKIHTAMSIVVQESSNTKVAWGDVRSAIDNESQARRTLTDMINDQDLPPISKTWVNRHVKKLDDLAKCRSMLGIMEDVKLQAMTGQADVSFTTLMDGVFALGRDRFTTGAQPLTNYLPAIHDEITARRLNDGVVGLVTGLTPFDEGTGGLQKKNLYYLGGRPGSMKSVVCGQVAISIANDGHKVVLASPEMSAEQYTMRVACRMAGINYRLYNRGQYNEQQEQKIHEAVDALRHENIIFNESGLQNTHSLRQDIIQYKPELLVVDYSQLFEPTRPKYSEYADVTMFSKELNTMKKDFEIPILAAVQLSRKVEERENKRPIKSDVRSSGQIEQDADVIYMLYRAREYAERDELGIWRIDDDEIDPDRLEWVAAKNRHDDPTDYDTFTRDGELWLYNEQS
jgi:replicative DNA helicase